MREYLYLLLVGIVGALVPRKLTPEGYEALMADFNDVHYFVFHEQLLDPEMIEHLDHYEGDKTVQLYQCNPNRHFKFCKQDVPLYLVMNSIHIQFNGNKSEPLDIKRWVQYRINENPMRIGSIQELKEQASAKFEIFCFVDRKGQEITKKERIFLAAAKTMHFLNFCYLDASIAKKVGLQEGHMSLVRRNMTFDIDSRTQHVHEDDTQLLYDNWVSFLINSFVNDFRIEGKNSVQDQILVECDLSLKCQLELSRLLMWEKVWRSQHPDYNFAIRIGRGKTATGRLSDEKEYPLPAIRYISKKAKDHYKEEEGGSLIKSTFITKLEYLAKDMKIDHDSVERLLQLKKQGKLLKARTSTSTNVQAIEAKDAHLYSAFLSNKEDL